MEVFGDLVCREMDDDAHMSTPPLPHTSTLGKQSPALTDCIRAGNVRGVFCRYCPSPPL